MDPNIFKHYKLLEGRDPEEVKKFISFLFLTIFRIQHTTSEMGIFFGGMYKGFELFMSCIHHNFKIPNYIELEKNQPELENVMAPYVDLTFELFEDWKRQTEGFQIKKGAGKFKLYESCISELYKNYQKRSQH